MQRLRLVGTALGSLAVVWALNALFIPVLSATQAPLLAHAQRQTVISLTVTVPGTQPWTDTGINLSAGTLVNITASGSIAFAGGPGNSYTPDGKASCAADESMVAPGITCFALVARIGNGVPFEIGTGTHFVAKDGGELGLGVNDGIFSDNSGSWTATVKVF